MSRRRFCVAGSVLGKTLGRKLFGRIGKTHASRARAGCVQEDAWEAGGWIAEQVALESGAASACELDVASQRGAASMARFVFGSGVKDFLETFIADCESASARAVRCGERVPLGGVAPGATFELRSGGESDSTESSSRRGTRARAGTAGLVLGAGNQSFLTLLDVSNRVQRQNSIEQFYVGRLRVVRDEVYESSSVRRSVFWRKKSLRRPVLVVRVNS